MKKIKYISSFLAAITLSSAVVGLTSCSKQEDESTKKQVPIEQFIIEGSTFKGFKEGTDLTKYSEISMPDTVKIIDSNAFANLPENITKIKFNKNNTIFRSYLFGKPEANTNSSITELDFSDYSSSDTYYLSFDKTSFVGLTASGKIVFNSNLSNISKDTLARNLMNSGISIDWFTKESSGNISCSQKELTCEEGQATFEFDLTEPVSTDTITCTSTTTASTETVTLSVNSSVTKQEAKAYVNAQLNKPTEFENDDYASFDITFACYSSTSKVIPKWIEKVSDLKLTIKQETVEQHTVSASSGIECITTTLDKEVIGKDDTFTLTLNNTGKVFTNQVSLIYTVGEQTFNETFESVAVGQTQIELSKEIINQKLSDHGLTSMGKLDAISLKVAIIGNYEVDDNIHLYKYNDKGQLVQLTDDEFTALEGKFFIKDEYGLLNISTVTLEYLLHNAAADSTNNIYLIKGTYTPGQAKRTSGPNTNANIYGILSYNNEKLATFQAYTPSTPEKLDCEAISFSLYDLNIECEKTQGITFYNNGIRSTVFNCTRCDFSGTYTLYSYGQFTDCNFDASMVKDAGGTDSEYCVFYYGAEQAQDTIFTNCNFKNCGKCFKAYNDMTTIVGKDTIKFVNCKFELVNAVTDIKCPLNIDGAYKSVDTAYYDIYYDSDTTMTGYASGTNMYSIKNGHCHINGQVPTV